MSGRHISAALFALVIIQSTANLAAQSTTAAGHNLRADVQAWLDTESEPFLGVIEFKKSMALPADPSRLDDVETVATNRAERTRKYFKDADELRTAGEYELLDAITTQHAVEMQQLRNHEDWLKHWSKERMNSHQQWRVYYLDDMNVRVERMLTNGPRDKEWTEAGVRVDARSYDQTWSWTRAPEANEEFLSLVRNAADGSAIKQGIRETKYLTGHPAGVTRHHQLTDVSIDGDQIVARLVKRQSDFGNVVQETTLVLERRNGDLVLVESEGQGNGRYFHMWFDDHRPINNQLVAHKLRYREGPVQEKRLDPASARETRSVVYTIKHIDEGFTQKQIELLQRPVEGTDKTYVAVKDVYFEE